MEKPSRTKADFALAFCSLLWGVTFVVVKNALDQSSVFVFLAVRFTVAAALMLTWSSSVLRQCEPEDLFAGIFVAELLGSPAAPESPEPTLAGRIYFEPWWRV